jgi:hypothetical protein
LSDSFVFLSASASPVSFFFNDTATTEIYTIFDIHPHFADEYIRRRAAPGGLTWHYARPPVQGLDYEVDVRGVGKELVI